MSHATSEQLLARLLALEGVTPSNATSTPHPDEEVLAQFVEGELEATQRDQLIAHLADCDACRELVSLVLQGDDRRAPHEAQSPAVSIRPRHQQRMVWAAVAATLLFSMLGTLAWRSLGTSEPEFYDLALARLQSRDFAEARKVVAQAESQGVLSDRLRTLDAQAILQIPQLVSLAHAGSLNHFGYDVGGIVARSASSASAADLQQSAARAPQAIRSREVLLNRGHLLLLQGNPAQADELFQAVILDQPNDSLAWLGIGLAAYMQYEFAAAERAFQKSLSLQPTSLPAQINLAMTLEDLDRWPEALAIWNRLLQRASLDETTRAKIRQHVQQTP